MDFVRTFYRTEMHLWGPGQPPVPVRWMRADPNAKAYPHPHLWHSIDWQNEGLERIPREPLGVRGEYDRGVPPFAYPGQEVHGPDSAFQGYGQVGKDPDLITDEEGALFECRPPNVSAPVLHADGGAKQGGETYFDHSGTLKSKGGQKQGGSAAIVTSHKMEPQGGQKQGGTGRFDNSGEKKGDGGSKQGGSGIPGEAAAGCPVQEDSCREEPYRREAAGRSPVRADHCKAVPSCSSPGLRSTRTADRCREATRAMEPESRSSPAADRSKEAARR